ncbi:hypothetical protein [Paraburkholderia diazotrophica]|uniref:Uncharacterized protein n=1 Tax=Paraburkholderia diazotrophica TaxID=667676 RepID=A0A1H7CTJ2_9BURK|nr:hypothetical protein [Paraburkholderia diazotrophica]SEJ92988.1 hypothetical protein SAMN05192539_102453 [Paraburkholderia diazotrophica]
MKSIIKLIICMCVILYGVRAFSAGNPKVYRGERGDALLIDAGAEKTFMIAGGALARGSATAGDCFARAILKLNKPPNYFEGELEPVENEIINVDIKDIIGRGVGVYVSKNRLKVGNVEVDGICADGIDFSGYYREIPERDAKYKSIFLYFMRLSEQNAIHLREAGNVAAAVNELKPFVDSCREKWCLIKK